MVKQIHEGEFELKKDNAFLGKLLANTHCRKAEVAQIYADHVADMVIDNLLEELSAKCVSIEPDSEGNFYWIAEPPTGPIVEGNDKASLLEFIKEQP